MTPTTKRIMALTLDYTLEQSGLLHDCATLISKMLEELVEKGVPPDPKIVTAADRVLQSYQSMEQKLDQVLAYINEATNILTEPQKEEPDTNHCPKCGTPVKPRPINGRYYCPKCPEGQGEYIKPKQYYSTLVQDQWTFKD